MLIIFGKGKVGRGVDHLLTVLEIPHIMMDDGDYDEVQLAQAEQILISPGIKLEHMLYKNYPDKIISELNFIAKILPTLPLQHRPEFIGITGTNGKSTTTRMLYNIFQNFFTDKKVHLTWNYDIPLSETLAMIIEKKQTDHHHVCIMECSSFMLYHLSDFYFDYSILLNIATDHLDWHKDFQDYTQAKLNILTFTKKIGFTNKQIFAQLPHSIQKHTQIYIPLASLTWTQFVGQHNQEDLWSALDLFHAYIQDHDIENDEQKIQTILSEISPLDHRLRRIATVQDIDIYDDSICTSAQALNAALQSFWGKVVLICWWYDKGEDYERLTSVFDQKVAYALLMGQTAPKFETICNQKNIPYEILSDFSTITQTWLQKAKDLQVPLLFSPWSASFDMFQNVYDRAQKFVIEIEKLQSD